jgi:hypothetical protein
MTEPTAEELGYADKVFVDELGDTSIVVFRMIDKVLLSVDFCSSQLYRSCITCYLSEIALLI